GLAWLQVRHGLRDGDVLGVVQAFDVGAVQQQEHHQHGQHVDERHQRHVAGVVTALPMFLDAIRCHFTPPAGAAPAAAAPTTGASPTEISGNSSTLVNNGGSSFSNSRTLSMVCTSTSYGIFSSSSTLAASTPGYLLFTNCRK